MQLIVTVAAQRMKNLTGGALRVNADHRRKATNVSENQNHRVFQVLFSGLSAGQERFKSNKAESRPACRKMNIGNLLEHHEGEVCGIAFSARRFCERVDEAYSVIAGAVSPECLVVVIRLFRAVSSSLAHQFDGIDRAHDRREMQE